MNGGSSGAGKSIILRCMAAFPLRGKLFTAKPPLDEATYALLPAYYPPILMEKYSNTPLYESHLSKNNNTVFILFSSTVELLELGMDLSF